MNQGVYTGYSIIIPNNQQEYQIFGKGSHQPVTFQGPELVQLPISQGGILGAAKRHVKLHTSKANDCRKKESLHITGQKLPPLQKKTVRNQKSLVQCVRHSYISPSTGKDSQPGWHFRWNPPSMTGKFDSINFIAIDLSAESCWTWWMISWLCQVFDPEFVALVNWKKKVVHIDLRGFLFCSTQTSTLKTTASLRKIKRRFIASLESRTVHGPPLGKHQCLEGAKVQLKRLPRNPKKKPITI